MKTKDSVRIDKFLGVDNVSPPERASEKMFQRMLNVEIDNSGVIKKRKGCELVYSGSPTSIFTNGQDILFVEGNTLKRLESNGDTTTIRTGIYGGKIAYVTVNDCTYYSDGFVVGVYQNGVSRSPAVVEGHKEDFKMESDNRLPLIPFENITFYRGRIYFSTGNTVFYSDPWRYEAVQYDQNHFSFDSQVTMLVGVENGIWVGTQNEAMFIGGQDPKIEGSLSVKNKVPVKVIPGTAQAVDGTIFKEDPIATGKVAIWATNSGIFMGTGEGLVRNVTGKYFVCPKSNIGISVVYSTNNHDKYLFSVQSGAGTGSGNITIS